MKKRRKKKPKAEASPGPDWIKVAYCRKCGRLLTGKKSIEEGIGRGCKAKSQSHRKLEAQGQLRLFDY